MRTYTLTLLASILLSLSVHADIYQSVDAEGNKVFSDQPSPNAKQLEIKETNTTKAIEISPRNTIKPQTPKAHIYEQFEISSPRDGSHLVNGLYPFNVNFSTKPALSEGHKIQLIINGSVHSTGSSLTRQVESIGRGEHSLNAAILDSNGKQLLNAKPVNITAQQPSILINPR